MPSASTAVMYVKKGLGGSASGLSGAMVVLIGGVMTSVTGVAVGNHPHGDDVNGYYSVLNFRGTSVCLWRYIYDPREELKRVLSVEHLH